MSSERNGEPSRPSAAWRDVVGPTADLEGRPPTPTMNMLLQPALGSEGAPTEPTLHDRTTTLSALAGADLGEGQIRRARLVLEAASFTGIGVGLTQALGVEQPGVISLFLAAGALSTRTKEILRTSESGESPRAAFDLLAVFLGIVLAYAITAAALGAEGTAAAFAFALEAAGAGTDDLLSRSIPGVLPIFGHNLAVLGAVVVLSVVYRTYGALLALTWNASVWGLILSCLALRAIASGQEGGALLAVGLCFLPHLALEAFGYVAGGLAGARLGRWITGQVELRLPIRAMGIAVLALLAAAVLESGLPAAMADWVTTLSPSLGVGESFRLLG